MSAVSRKYTVGFGPMSIPPKSNVAITTRATSGGCFKTEKFVNTGDEGLQISEAFVGNKIQDRSEWSKGVTVLSKQDSNVMDAVWPWDEIMFIVQNVTDEQKTFSCTLIGEVRFVDFEKVFFGKSEEARA